MDKASWWERASLDCREVGTVLVRVDTGFFFEQG